MSWWLDISDLDVDQRKVIALPAAGDYLILGPPGSGKTNLLLIRAEYLIRTSQPNLYVLMFNEPLHDFVVRGGAHYDVPSDKIRKMLSWEIRLLRENNVSVADLPEDGLDQRRDVLASRVIDLLDQTPALNKHLDCLLVDEIQDCLASEVEVFLRCAKHVCFGGDNRQRIHNNESVIPDLSKRLETIELRKHYRIGHEICRVADVVGKNAGFDPIEGTCNYKDAEAKVHFVPCASDDEQAGKIIEALQVQLTAYPDELLAVVAPRKCDRDFLRSKLTASAMAPHLLPPRKSGSEDPDQRIYVAHLLEIKGLEFRTIHIGLMQHHYKLGGAQKRIAYTAITRGKTTVSIYFHGKIPGYLEQSQVAIEPPRPKIPLAELFPRKRGEK